MKSPLLTELRSKKSVAFPVLVIVWAAVTARFSNPTSARSGVKSTLAMMVDPTLPPQPLRLSSIWAVKLLALSAAFELAT